MPQALIWGASGGMGQALVSTLKAADWHVLAAARTPEKVPEEADAIAGFDASDDQSIAEAVRLLAMEAQGNLDLMVYAAGCLSYEKLGKIGAEGWRATLDSNLGGAYSASAHALPLMRKDAHLVFIGAYLDHIRLPKMGAYAVAKAGLEELATMLAKENRKMRVTLVRPGAVNTPFWEQVSFKMPEDAKTPATVAQAILQRYESGESGELNL